MLNMKKGLAIVLAAATVLTFAPVSTLGLQGVVEAQAATVQATNDSATVTLNGSADANLSKTSATVKAGGSLTLTFENSSASAIADAEITAKKAGSPSDTGLTVKQDGTALTGASSVFTLNSIAAKTGTTNGKTTVVISFAGTAATGADYTFEINYGSHSAQTLIVTYKNIADAQKDQDLADASNAIFQGVDDTVYLRNTNDFSMDLKPSVITAGGKSYNGSDLYYQAVLDSSNNEVTAPLTTTALTLAHGDYKGEAQGVTTKINFKAEKGKLTLARKDSTSANDFVAGSFILAAYTANTDDNDYTLVGYKTINVKISKNETYTLGLKDSSYTMSIGTVDSTDALEVDSVGKSDGTKLSATTTPTLASFKNAVVANWTVSGRGITTVGTDTAAAGTFGDDIIAVYSTASKKFFAKHAGTSEATITVANDNKQIAQAKVALTVLGTSQYALKATADGTNDSAEIGSSASNPIILDVKTNNTYDLAKHLYKSEGMVLSYDSSNTKNTVDANGVVKVTTAADFYVTVTGKVNGATVKQIKVYFKANALPYDVPSVTGADKDVADVLNEVDYASVVGTHTIPSEKQLAASQIKYVQIDVTGTESTNVTEALNIVSTSGAIVTASLDAAHSSSTISGVSSNGVITLTAGATAGTAAIKLVSSATSNTALSTNYVFVVVDKKDPEIKAADTYTIGARADAEDNKSYESDINFTNYIAKAGVTVEDLVKADDLHAAKTLYANAANSAVNNANFANDFRGVTVGKETVFEGVHVAKAAGKTEHLLISYNAGNGTAYKVVTINSVAGVHNSVTKIEDATNNKVVYTPDMGTAIPELILDGNTTLKVTLAYSIDKNKTTSDITSTSLYLGDALNQNIMTRTKENVKKGDTYNTFYLYPTTKGTQTVTVVPSGDISDTDHSIVDNDKVQLAVTYRANTAPSKVTGLKVKNKKGAKVTVTFDAATNHNMKYWVQKKIGKKVSGKSVASNKTTLSVKKGATVKVRVKAYYYDNEGNKHVGKYSAWKTLKTDKK